MIFPFCSRSQTDGPAPIPVEEERPTAYDESSTEETQRNPEPSQDYYIQVPFGINIPNQDPPGAGHASDHTHSSSSNYPMWRPPPETELDAPSPLFLDSPEASTSPPPYHSSPLYPPIKRAQLKTGHQSSISDRHQYKLLQGHMLGVLLCFSVTGFEAMKMKPWLSPQIGRG